MQLLEKEMQYALERAGCFIAGPTATLAPADKELYKRRDVTATVDSIPLCVGEFLSIYVLLIRIIRWIQSIDIFTVSHSCVKQIYKMDSLYCMNFIYIFAFR